MVFKWSILSVFVLAYILIALGRWMQAKRVNSWIVELIRFLLFEIFKILSLFLLVKFLLVMQIGVTLTEEGYHLFLTKPFLNVFYSRLLKAIDITWSLRYQWIRSQLNRAIRSHELVAVSFTRLFSRIFPFSFLIYPVLFVLI